MESSNEFLIGALAGGLTVLLVQLATILFGLRKISSKKKYPDTYHRDLLEDPSCTLVKMLGISTKDCTDLAWLNVSLQRFFCEVSKSNVFYERVKANLVKKLSVAFSSGILKKITFKDVSFGSEAPYIHKIRIMSEDEIKELLEKKEGSEIKHPSAKPAWFKQVYLLIDMEYISTDNCFYIDADLIKGYSIPIMVKLQPFKGQLIMRIPADNYSTRFEIGFVENPGFDFSVEAAFSKNDSVFFSSSVSTILKKLFKYIAKMYVYPNWYYYYLPMVVSRSKVVTYPYYPVSENKKDASMHQAREAQNLFSLDYTILSKKGNIIFRRTKSTVNSSGAPIDKAEIEVSSERQKQIEEMLKHPEKFDLFVDVISDYEGSKVVEKYSDSVMKIHVIIAGGVYEFIKIAVENMIIFQLTDASEPQFIAVKKEGNGISILQYTARDSPFRLGRFRIIKLAAKLEEQEMKVFGSTKLFKILDFSVKQAEKTTKIFKKSKDKEKIEKARENTTKDISKMQYVSDGYSLDPNTSASSISEVSIIETHFRAIETKIVSENTEPMHRLHLPYSSTAINQALESSLIRASLLERFTIMEDIRLTDRICSTSMAHASGQYVQLLTYFSADSEFVIQKVLLSEEFQGITVALKISNGQIDIFVQGEAALKKKEFVSLIHACVRRAEVLKAPAQEVPKQYISSMEECSGIVITSETPSLCEIKISKGEWEFSADVLLDEPFSVIFGEGADPLKVFLKSKKKLPLHVSTVPTGAKDEMFHIQGKVFVKRKEKLQIPVGKGVVYWKSPWASPDKNKTEDMQIINGRGYTTTEESMFLTWINKTGKDTPVSIEAGSINLSAPIEEGPQLQEEVS
ncbi:hypothetical protein NECID01_0603 [Nematocida sp. AWRm77]|nr:hypothetical protein NECID01_0603 [Nematocida sp. AWRm77]